MAKRRGCFAGVMGVGGGWIGFAVFAWSPGAEVPGVPVTAGRVAFE